MSGTDVDDCDALTGSVAGAAVAPHMLLSRSCWVDHGVEFTLPLGDGG